MQVLVWQWGRRGGAPRFAASLAAGARRLPGVTAALSLARQAEILAAPDAPDCALPVATYDGGFGLLARLLCFPWLRRTLQARLVALAPDVAICALPGPLDLVMLAALHRLHVPVAVVIHDADAHPGDGFPLLMAFQRALARRADLLVALSGHVARRLVDQGLASAPQPGASGQTGAAGRKGGRPLLVARHPPFQYGVTTPAVPHDGPARLLCFGRLLPYKGLDLLDAALARLGPRADYVLRIVGSGPDSPELAALAARPGVTVENRWVGEAEMPALIAWADLLVLPYREASQSGVAATALAARRRVISTRVGGLIEQLSHEPLATLCEPDAESLAATLAAWLDDPPPPAAEEGSSADAAWRDFAEAILLALARTAPGHASAKSPLAKTGAAQP